MDNMVSAVFVILGLAALIAFVFLRREAQRDRASRIARSKLSKSDRAILKANAVNYILPVPNPDVPTEREDGFGLRDVAWQATEKILDNARPDPQELAALDKGAMVELMATKKDGNIAAPIVVRIRSLLKNDYFTGEIQEDSDGELSLREGQALTFHANHIQTVLP
ncbi:MAG: hypothetical protein ACE5FS_03530 [Paracoccaceae bacterium]